MLFFQFLLQGWPEGAAVFFSTFSIVGYNPKICELVGYSFAYVSIIYLFRILVDPFGLHTIVGLILVVAIVHKVTNVSLGSSFFAAFCTLFILVSVETLIHLLFVKLFGNVNMSQNWLWLVIGWPQIFCLTGVAIIVRKVRPILVN